MKVNASFSIRKASLVVALISLLSASAFSQSSGGSGGSGTYGGSYTANGWQVTATRSGKDTLVFPKYDSAQGTYRLYTYCKDWASGTWTEDGNPMTGAGFANAAWNTPTSFTGSAESTGTVDISVQWVGSGPAPTYCYLMLSSSATAFEDWGRTATISADDGQNDSATITSSSGSATGTHPKRLKVNGSGMATYTISMSAKVSRTGTVGSLVASSDSMSSIDVKALSVFAETYKRVEINQGDIQSVYPRPAWTGDIEHEKAEVGVTDLLYDPPVFYEGDNFDPQYCTSGTLWSSFTVDRIGSWVTTDGFSSSISAGSRSESYPPNVTSIIAHETYSGSELKSMRTDPKKFTITVHQSDPESLIPGPFDSQIEVSVWAPERIIHIFSVDEQPEVSYLKLTADSDYQDVGPGEDTTVTVGTTETNEVNCEVSLTAGIPPVPNPIVEVGVKADCGFKLGYKHSVSSYAGTSTRVHDKPYTTRVRFKLTTTRHDMNRDLAKYTESGYDSEFSNTILNSSSPTIASQWEFEVVNGS